MSDLPHPQIQVTSDLIRQQNRLINTNLQCVSNVSTSLKRTDGQKSAIRRLRFGDNVNDWIHSYETAVRTAGIPICDWKSTIDENISHVYKRSFALMLRNSTSDEDWHQFKHKFCQTFGTQSQQMMSISKFEIITYSDRKDIHSFIDQCWKAAEELGEQSPQTIGILIAKKMPPKVKKRLLLSIGLCDNHKKAVIECIITGVNVEKGLSEFILSPNLAINPNGRQQRIDAMFSDCPPKRSELSRRLPDA